MEFVTRIVSFYKWNTPNIFADFILNIELMSSVSGRYVGSRPIKLRKSTWRNRNLDIARKKEKEKQALIGLLTGHWFLSFDLFIGGALARMSLGDRLWLGLDCTPIVLWKRDQQGSHQDSILNGPHICFVLSAARTKNHDACDGVKRKGS